MGGEHDGGTEIIDLLENLNDFVGIHWIEISCRLVGDDDVRLIDDSASDGYALLLSS